MERALSDKIIPDVLEGRRGNPDIIVVTATKGRYQAAFSCSLCLLGVRNAVLVT